MSNKAALRIKYKKLRKDLSDMTVEELSLQIANKCLSLPIWKKTYYHLYLTILSKKEVDTSTLLHILQGRDKSIVISKSNFATNEMDHFLLQENTVLKISGYGIPEPTSGIQVAPEIIDVVFVPLLAYDERGHRIGYGKGFYDRFLKECRADALFIGLSFFPPEPDVFAEGTDVPLDFCVTPEKIFEFRNKQLSL